MTHGVEMTWPMIAGHQMVNRRPILPNTIESSSNKGDENQPCQPEEDRCIFSLKNLRIRSTYTIILFIKERSDRAEYKDGRQEWVTTQCPQENITLNVWPCDGNQKILADQPCNGKIECLNARDESVCRGEETIFSVSIAFIATLSLGFISAMDKL